MGIKSFPTATVPSMGFSRQEEEDMQELGIEPEGRSYWPGKGLFLSKANFEGVRKVQKCLLGRRAVGLLLEYQDGRLATLGQWYVENTYAKARVEVVYDWKEHGSQVAECFEFSFEGEEARRTVVDVTLHDSTTQASSQDHINKFSGRCNATVCVMSPLHTYETVVNLRSVHANEFLLGYLLVVLERI